MQKNISVVCYDLPTISRFIRSCALVIATQHSMKVEWETYRDSKVINAIYTVFFWKEPPGIAVVKDGAPAEIERRTDQMFERFILAWVRKLAEQGPRAGQEYLSFLGHLRDMARNDILNLYREVSGINSDVIRETQQGIKNLARIKLGAQVGVAVIGGIVGVGFVAPVLVGGTLAAGGGLTILGLQAGTTAGGFAVAGFAHSITHSIIKNWEAGAEAQVAVIVNEDVGKEVGKTLVGHVGDRAVEHTLEKALAGSAKAQQAMRSAQGEINKYSARLAQEGLTRKASEKAARRVADNMTRVATRTAEIAKHKSAAASATRAGVYLPVLFAGLDIRDAWNEYNETMERNR
ncbi:hypothetical protein QO058_06405 [Bosea vestrisii]|uniref:hypothetical protein n=1 Tax=Bosea vestrisii TaxID=151416 RepID=UPI0024DFA6EA|nr:hypothetical protein [Bosea vestrisii]WID97878.1 hypothetical protein QO058_06405 [Bosea vestrisii]